MAPWAVKAECPGRDRCSCSAVFDCRARAQFAGLADVLTGRALTLRSNWQLRLHGAGQEATRAWSIEDTSRLLEAATRAGAPEVAAACLVGARRWRELGVTLPEAIVASQLFGAALRDTLEAPLGAHAPPSDPDGVTRLGWLVTSLIGVAYGADIGGSQPGPALAGLPQRDQLCGLIGASPAMQRLYARIELASRGRETILLIGESGVGKELVARAIHQAAGDPSERFVAVNCAALPQALLESELFGHRRGAFSGAAEPHPGLIRAAAGGTLFLDEISELAPEAQAKLLRVIQERAVRAVGDLHESPVEVRIVAATNRDPKLALAEGQLRRDLYYRLQRLVIDVPPLRDRRSDIPLLVATFGERWRVAYREARAKSFTPDALAKLGAHGWPGNVRELENVVFSASLACSGAFVHPEHLPALDPDGTTAEEGPAPASMRDAERRAISGALDRAQGNKSLAARILGISRKQLYAKIDRYEL